MSPDGTDEDLTVHRGNAGIPHLTGLTLLAAVVLVTLGFLIGGWWVWYGVILAIAVVVLGTVVARRQRKRQARHSAVGRVGAETNTRVDEMLAGASRTSTTFNGEARLDALHQVDAEPEAKAEQLLNGANFAGSHFQDERLDRLLQASLDLMAVDVAAELEPGEDVLLTTCCSVSVTGKPQPGLVTITTGRVLLAWSTGFRPPVTHFESTPVGAEVTQRLEKLGMLKGWGTYITVHGQPQMTFCVHDTETGVLGNLVQGMASGYIKRGLGE